MKKLVIMTVMGLSFLAFLAKTHDSVFMFMIPIKVRLNSRSLIEYWRV